jgi:hypothetical protein
MALDPANLHHRGSMVHGSWANEVPWCMALDRASLHHRGSMVHGSQPSWCVVSSWSLTSPFTRAKMVRSVSLFSLRVYATSSASFPQLNSHCVSRRSNSLPRKRPRWRRPPHSLPLLAQSARLASVPRCTEDAAPALADSDALVSLTASRSSFLFGSLLRGALMFVHATRSRRARVVVSTDLHATQPCSFSTESGI